MTNLRSFLENATRSGTKLSLHLQFLPFKTRKMPYNKISIVMGLFDLFGIPKIINKAVFEPRVWPAFAITYFYNRCNIRFENTSKYVDTMTLLSKT